MTKEMDTIMKIQDYCRMVAPHNIVLIQCTRNVFTLMKWLNITDNPAKMVITTYNPETVVNDNIQPSKSDQSPGRTVKMWLISTSGHHLITTHLLQKVVDHHICNVIDLIQ